MNMTKSQITQIRKRKGKIVSFNEDKIISAIYGATEAVGKADKHFSDLFC